MLGPTRNSELVRARVHLGLALFPAGLHNIELLLPYRIDLWGIVGIQLNLKFCAELGFKPKDCGLSDFEICAKGS
jgi:hypothetical protein